MLRILLITTALLTASGAALAHSDDSYYGRVIAAEPRVSISVGTGYYNGFRVLYESGGSHYWTYTPHYPGDVIVLPPPHRVRHIHRHRDYGHGWDDRGGWSDRHDGWRDGRREHRRHGRD